MKKVAFGYKTMLYTKIIKIRDSYPAEDIDEITEVKC